MDVFQFKMLRAALKQALRDRKDDPTLTQEDIDRVLDQISALTRLINDLEEKKE